jgi:leucyl aminopeptidase
MELTRDLGNLPANVCTPSHLGERALELARDFPDIKVTVLERKEHGRAQDGLVPVGHARQRRAAPVHRLRIPRQRTQAAPGRARRKGITFDTGGISLKPAHDMDHMKFDMCGAGERVRYAAGGCRAQGEGKRHRPGRRVRNMPSGRATKPGDVVTSMSGQTIEILNTDAEGRLILADALDVRERYEPEAVVDIATLTGAIVVALGHVACGVFSNSDTLARALIGAGDDAYDRAMAAAAVGRLSRRPQQQLRRLRQSRGSRRRQHHRGLLSVAVREEVRLGAPGHRGHRVERGQGERGNRPPGPAADDVDTRAGAGMSEAASVHPRNRPLI